MATIRPPRSPALQQLVHSQLEPLPEARWDKIEQAAFARLDREQNAGSGPLRPLTSAGRARLLAWWPAAAAACVAAVVALWLASAEPALSRISTGASASHVVLPGVELDIAPESAVVVSGSVNESQLLVLDRGEVTCEVAHRAVGKPFLVQAGEVRVEVVGTRFHVARDGEAARVTVQEGVVKVSSRGRTERVVAGQSWPKLSATVTPTPPMSAAPPARAMQPDADDSTSREPPVTPRSLDVPVVDARNSARSMQADFEAAARLEAQSPDEAIRLYRKLQGGSNSWAQNALFAQGRLEAARGNRSEARRALGRYLERFPRGPNAIDARRLLKHLE